METEKKIQQRENQWESWNLKNNETKKGREKSYLKLDDGSSLPLSHFEVSGADVKNGIKGFIFGERGVWRPGDSLFLTCIIEDKDKKLPANHPIEMDLISPRGQLYKKILSKYALPYILHNLCRTVYGHGCKKFVHVSQW